jgi:hypothetical protein
VWEVRQAIWRLHSEFNMQLVLSSQWIQYAASFIMIHLYVGIRESRWYDLLWHFWWAWTMGPFRFKKS